MAEKKDETKDAAKPKAAAEPKSRKYPGDGTDANAQATAEPEGALKSGMPQHYGIAGGESYAKD